MSSNGERVIELEPLNQLSSYDATFQEYQHEVINSYSNKPLKKIPKNLSINNCNLEKAMNLLVSNEDRSKDISLILKSFNLYNNVNFWNSSRVQNLKTILNFYYEDYGIASYFSIQEKEARTKNFLSIIMFDWLDSEEGSKEYFNSNIYDDNCIQLVVKNLISIVNDRDLKGFLYFCNRAICQLIQEFLTDERRVEGNYNLNEFPCDIQKIVIASKVFNCVQYDKNNSNYECSTTNYASWEGGFDTKCCELFGKLITLIEKGLVHQFRFTFEEEVELYKKIYGSYSELVIKSDVELINLFIKNSGFSPKYSKEISDYLQLKCPSSESNVNLLKNLEELADFYRINTFNNDYFTLLFEIQSHLASLNGDSLEEIEFFKYPDDNHQLFGRKSVHHLSMFEEILKTPKMGRIIDKIWDEFKLNEKSGILTMRNPQGKLLLEFIVESKCCQNMSSFLSKALKNKDTSYFKMINNQYYSLTSETLIQWILEFLENENFQLNTEFFKIIKKIFNFLHEIGEINFENRDSLVEYFIKLLESKITSEKLFIVKHVLLRMMIYWTPGGFYGEYKSRILQIDSNFIIMFDIIERNCEMFEEKLKEIVAKWDTELSECMRQIAGFNSETFVFSILLGALQRGLKDEVDVIFKHASFKEKDYLQLPRYKVPCDIHFYSVYKFLTNGTRIEENFIPDCMVNFDVLKNYLDSHIQQNEENRIDVDLTPMINPCDESVTKDYVEIPMVLNIICSDERFRELLTHPVVGIFIELKYIQCKKIFYLDLLLFLIFSMTPLMIFIFYERHVHQKPFWSFCAAIFGISYLILKEIFIYKYLSLRQKWKEENVIINRYLQERFNYLKLSFILLSTSLLIACYFQCMIEVCLLLESAVVITTAWVIMTGIREEVIEANVRIIRRVINTFFKVFLSFILILLAFALSFYIIFNKTPFNDDSNIVQLDNNGTKNLIETSTETVENNVKNFERIPTSIVKLITMLSGEFSFEPVTLLWYQLILFITFVFFSFILFNSLIGLSTEDVKELARMSLYNRFKQKLNYISKVNLYFKCFQCFFARLENYEKVYIDEKSKLVYRICNGNVEYFIENRWFRIKYSIDDELFLNILEIIDLRKEQEMKVCEKLMSKI